MPGEMGVIYLLHLVPPYKHAKHYLGWCNSYSGLDSRFEYHARGNGSKLMKAHCANGGTFKLVRLWKGTRDDERRIHNMRCDTKFCPECGGTRKLRGLEEMDV